MHPRYIYKDEPYIIWYHCSEYWTQTLWDMSTYRSRTAWWLTKLDLTFISAMYFYDHMYYHMIVWFHCVYVCVLTHSVENVCAAFSLHIEFFSQNNKSARLFDYPMFVNCRRLRSSRDKHNYYDWYIDCHWHNVSRHGIFMFAQNSPLFTW